MKPYAITSSAAGILIIGLGSCLIAFGIGTLTSNAKQAPNPDIVATNAVTFVIEHRGTRIGISFDETSKKPNWPISIQVQVNDTTKVYKP